MRTTHLWRAAFALTFAASAYLLLMPRPLGDGGGSALPDWLGHLLLFAALGLTLARSLQIPPAIAYALIVAWGAATEILQLAIPGRTGTMEDLAVDALGALAAFLPYKSQRGR